LTAAGRARISTEAAKKPAMALVNRRVIEGAGMKKKGKKDDKKKGK
jgi:hypothetical protein